MDDIKYLLNKDERVSLTDMLKAYTINAAYNQFLENDLGSLEVGKLADFIVLDKDPYEVDPIELEKIKVISTYFGGEEVC